MDRKRSGNVKIDMNVLEWATLDNARNTNNSEYNSRKSSARKYSAYRNDLGAVHYPSLSILEDTTHKTNVESATPFDNKIYRERSKESLSRGKVQVRKNTRLDKTDQESRDRNLIDIQKRDDGERFATSLVSPTANTIHRPESRPGSARKKIPLSERPMSSLTANGVSPRPNSSRKLGRHSLKARQTSSGDDDDEDISLEGLSELLGTVRQYAQEIHDIYAPMKKDEEERIRRRDERKSRRKSKENNSLAMKSNKPLYQEVRVEIHKTGDLTSEKIIEEGRRASRHDTLSLSKSHDPSSSKYPTSLHVEEENLSKTWPRGHQKPTSRERFWPDATQNKQKTYGTPPSSYIPRPKTPTDWNEAISIQHEKEMLNKAFQRIHKPNDDPLLGISSKSRSRSQIHEQMINSRQSVIEVARQHKQSRQIALPSIGIITPSTEYRNKLWNSLAQAIPSAPPDCDNSTIVPSAPSLEEEEFHSMNISNDSEVSGEKMPSCQFRKRSTDLQSNTKSGSRGRKTFDEDQDPDSGVCKN